MGKKYIITKKNASNGNAFDNMVGGVEDAGIFFKAVKSVCGDCDDEELTTFFMLSMFAPEVMATDEMIESAIPAIKKVIYMLGEMAKEVISPAVMKDVRDELLNETIENGKTE